MVRPLLLACTEGKGPDRYIFECERERTDERGLGKPHWRDWILHNVHRVCDLAQVPSGCG